MRHMQLNGKFKKTTASFRLAKPADTLTLAEIHACSWSAAYKDIIPNEYIKQKNATRVELWKKSVTDDNSMHYVIEANGTTLGFMSIAAPKDDDVDDSFYEIHAIYLRPDFFRKGIGTQAVNFAFDEAGKLGKRSVILWVLEDNKNSVMFYEKCGFAADGKINFRDFGKQMKLIRMRKDLS